ncbi:MAG: hypothetical protein WD002_05650 [Pseudomonadales bacterium]
MTEFSKLTVAFSLMSLLAACSEPVSFIPGGSLSGEVRQPPLEWMGVPETIQVETNPVDPYSINIWAVDIGEHLYIATGADGTTWSGYIEQNPSVRVRVDGNLYDFTASKVTDPVEHADVADLYVQKYELDPADNWVETGIVFRFDRL